VKHGLPVESVGEIYEDKAAVLAAEDAERSDHD